MPALENARPFKRLSNVELLNWVRKVNSTDYEQRVPEASKANLEIVMDAIFNHTPTRNEFIGTMVNKIGLSRAESTVWVNRLKNYKRERLSYGDTFEHTFIGLAEAHIYDADRDYLEKVLFGRETPETQTVFHKVTRQEFYKITIDLHMLKRAFNSEFGLSDFVTRLMQSPATSDEWDEFLQMTSLFRNAYDRGAYFVRQVDNVAGSGSIEDAAKGLIRQLRADAATLQYVSRHYNPSGMPVAVNPEDLIVITTPEAQAAMDVDALAAAFNIDRSMVPGRIEVIPQEHINIPGFQAMLTTRDFFVVMDTLYETASQQNAATLTENHFLHHHEIISLSPFAPAILYSSTDAPTVIPSDDAQPVSIDSVTAYELLLGGYGGSTVTEVERGRYYQITANATTDPEGGVRDDVKLTLAGAVSEFGRLTETGTLYVGPNEASAVLTVTATSIYDDTITAELELAVGGERIGYWPDEGDDGTPDEGDDGTP